VGTTTTDGGREDVVSIGVTYACELCGAGEFTATGITHRCQTCEEGKIAAAEGSTACTSCSFGKVASSNRTKCLLSEPPNPQETVPFNQDVSAIAKDSITMEFYDFTHSGDLICHAPFWSIVEPIRRPSNDTKAYIREHGITTTIPSTTVDGQAPVLVTFEGLMPLSSYGLFCFLEYEEDGVRKTSKLFVGNWLETGNAYPFPLEDECYSSVQQHTNTTLTISLAAYGEPGTIYLYAMEDTREDFNPNTDKYVKGSVAFPTRDEIRSLGAELTVQPFSSDMQIVWSEMISEEGVTSTRSLWR